MLIDATCSLNLPNHFKLKSHLSLFKPSLIWHSASKVYLQHQYKGQDYIHVESFINLQDQFNLELKVCCSIVLNPYLILLQFAAVTVVKLDLYFCFWIPSSFSSLLTVAFLIYIYFEPFLNLLASLFGRPYFLVALSIYFDYNMRITVQALLL